MATLLHTSDWHVGKGLGNVDRLADHRAALEAIVAAAREHRPDVILHTGDVFDGPRPGHEHVQLAVSALRELAALAPTVVLAGNHDSQALFGVFTTLLGDDAALRFIGKGRKPAEGGIVQIETAGGERVRIAPAAVRAREPASRLVRRPGALHGRLRRAFTADLRATGRGLGRRDTIRPATCSCSPRTCTSAARLRRAASARCT